MKTEHHHQSTGLLQEKFLLLKIKDNAVLAGPFHAQAPMNHVMLFSDLLSGISLNNNWLTVLECMEIRDATEVTISGQINMLWNMVLQLNKLIHIQELQAHAKLKEALGKLHHKPWLQLIHAMLYRQLLLNNQHQLELMHKHGNSIPEVFSKTAEQVLITMF
jgi:PHP family Zn ribbon phosphoesterase